MFESIRKHWAEARAGVVSDQVQDILQRYERMNPNDRYWVSSAFDAVMSELEEQLGPVAQWDAEHKQQVAKQIMQGAQQAFTAPGDNMSAETTRLGAHGGALASCYLELQNLVRGSSGQRCSGNRGLARTRSKILPLCYTSQLEPPAL